MRLKTACVYWGWRGIEKLSRAVAMAAGKTFLTICIPLSLIVYSCIPPAVLLASTYLLAPAKFEELQNFVNAYLPAADPAELPVVATKKGCTCKFPFTYNGMTHTKCIMLEGLALVGEAAGAFGCVRGARRARERLLTTAALLPHCLLPRWLAMSDTLWCDTGPECGTPYDPADRQYTNRGCCFDVCVDAQGKPQQRKSFKDRLSL